MWEKTEPLYTRSKEPSSKGRWGNDVVVAKRYGGLRWSWAQLMVAALTSTPQRERPGRGSSQRSIAPADEPKSRIASASSIGAPVLRRTRPIASTCSRPSSRYCSASLPYPSRSSGGGTGRFPSFATRTADVLGSMYEASSGSMG